MTNEKFQEEMDDLRDLVRQINDEIVLLQTKRDHLQAEVHRYQKMLEERK